LAEKRGDKLPVAREDDDKVVITLPDRALDTIDTVVVLEIKGKCEVKK